MAKYIKQNSVNEWLELAKSEDESRYNLCEVYRDTNTLVATDGNRLHWIDNLPTVQAHYPSGLDAQYPDYKCVMDKSPVSQSVTIAWNGIDFKALKAFAALAKTTGKNASAIVTIEEKKIVLSIASENITATLKIDCFDIIDSKLVTAYNIEYLIDALNLLQYDGVMAKLDWRNGTSPLQIDYIGKNAHAIIMPVRIHRESEYVQSMVARINNANMSVN